MIQVKYIAITISILQAKQIVDKSEIEKKGEKN